MIFMLFISAALNAAEKVIFEAKSINDWGAAVRKTTFHDGVFDTNKDLFVVISKKAMKIEKGIGIRASLRSPIPMPFWCDFGF